jgi:subtilisin family serine protease
MPRQPKQPDWAHGLPLDVVDQVQYIIEAFGRVPARDGGPITIGVARRRDRGDSIDYLYAEGRILVRDEYFEQVLALLVPANRRDAVRNDPDLVRRLIPGVTRLALTDKSLVVENVLRTVEQQFGLGVATPDHVLTVAGGHGHPCPATEPQEVYDETEPYPSVCGDGGGTGVLIYMDDTGLLAAADTDHPWLAGVVAGNIDPLPGLQGGVQHIPLYTGHGTFVAGVARCMAPAAEVIVTNVFSVAGSQLESDWIPSLEAALGRGGVDIFHLTVSAHSRRDLPLITFREWLRHLRQYGGAVCVAAAGNDGDRRPSWPAAFSEVVSVGALGRDWRGRATFSNFGPWVDVYAPGRDLVNAFATGMYKCHWHPYKGRERQFYGMAKWSGTSFSAPIVTGLIAARIARTGENGPQAAAALLAGARRQAVPGVGPVLLPNCGGEAHPPGCGHGHSPECCHRCPPECGCRCR